MDKHFNGGKVAPQFFIQRHLVEDVSLNIITYYYQQKVQHFDVTF